MKERLKTVSGILNASGIVLERYKTGGRVEVASGVGNQRVPTAGGVAIAGRIAEQRLKAGKKARGIVRIEAITKGSQTGIRVTDDGRGIDPELVSRAAAELGIIDPDHSFDLDRSLRLIFRAGFSTASNVTSVSGRGVGLDVVESAVEQAGGEIRVSSEPGHGSLFEILLPVTFGLLRTTVIVAAGNRYCIDASQLQGTQTVDARQIEERDGARVLLSEEEILPLVNMGKLLGEGSEETDLRQQFKIITYQFSE